MKAAVWGHLKVVRLLVHHGADLSKTNSEGVRGVALVQKLRIRDLCPLGWLEEKALLWIPLKLESMLSLNFGEYCTLGLLDVLVMGLRTRQGLMLWHACQNANRGWSLLLLWKGRLSSTVPLDFRVPHWWMTRLIECCTLGGVQQRRASQPGIDMTKICRSTYVILRCVFPIFRGHGAHDGTCGQARRSCSLDWVPHGQP